MNLDTFKDILPTQVYDLVDSKCLTVEDRHDQINEKILPRQDWKGN